MKNFKKSDLNAKGIFLYLLISFPYILFIAYLYGMSEAYFPDPIQVIPGQFIDVGIMIAFFGIFTYSIIIAIFGVYVLKFKKKVNNRR